MGPWREAEYTQGRCRRARDSIDGSTRVPVRFLHGPWTSLHGPGWRPTCVLNGDGRPIGDSGIFTADLDRQSGRTRRPRLRRCSSHSSSGVSGRCGSRVGARSAARPKAAAVTPPPRSAMTLNTLRTRSSPTKCY
jgi:hypothetical protein